MDTKDNQKHSKSASGFQITTSVYECDSCERCPMKERFIKVGDSKKPLEERHKVLYVFKRFQRQRETMEEINTSPEGKLLRINRSIQAEGFFAYFSVNSSFGARIRSKLNGCCFHWI
ncbi:MAG: transposase [Clostridia bacterium]|nr:transposase [Clostridia bacterium]